jgi:hypothetical protein
VSYPQQGGYPQQQPYSGGGYPTTPSGGGTNPATAIIAALLALAVTAFEIIFLVNFFDLVKVLGGLGNMPPKMWAVIGVDGVAGLLLLLGAILTFARKTAGAALIIVGSIIAIIGFFLYPVMLRDFSVVGDYVQAVFKFTTSDATFQALLLICAPLALIFAVLPSTFNHLRGGGGDSDHDATPYPSSGGFQQQQPYNPNPSSDPFPQQGYPQQQGGYPPQGGYPQQGQQGGYPPQQQGW